MLSGCYQSENRSYWVSLSLCCEHSQAVFAGRLARVLHRSHFYLHLCPILLGHYWQRLDWTLGYLLLRFSWTDVGSHHRWTIRERWALPGKRWNESGLLGLIQCDLGAFTAFGRHGFGRQLIPIIPFINIPCLRILPVTGQTTGHELNGLTLDMRRDNILGRMLVR